MLSIDFTGRRSGNAGVGEPFAISADGRFAAFTGQATNYVANDTNGTSDVFVHDCVLRRHIWDTTHGLHRPALGAVRGSSPWSLTPDGRYLVFASTATNLVSGFTFTPNGGSQLYVRDLVSNLTILVTVAHDGTNIAGGSHGFFPAFDRSISSDGRCVSFLSGATNLTPLLDLNGTSDVFCRDLSNGNTELITVVPNGDRAVDAFISDYSMSTNGRFFAFETAATNVVAGIFNTARTMQVYWRDRLAGTSALVSVTMEGGFAPRNASLQDMSRDGRYVCFLTTATNIVGGQNESGNDNDLFIRDMFQGDAWLVTRNTNDGASGGAQGGQFSANGAALIFSAAIANLVPGIADINGNNTDIFVHHLDSRSNAIVSASWPGNTGASSYTADGFAKISATARYVLFTSTATNLLPDGSGPQRMYLRDLQAAYTLDPLRSPYFPTLAFNEARFAITEDDRYIFFLTQANFDASVTDINLKNVDLFRAPLYEPKFLSVNPLLADGLPNTSYHLEASANLLHWSAVQTNIADRQGRVSFQDSTVATQRFYRLVWP